MELVRYADRPDLRELRRAALNEFPEFMNHNAMGWKYWGRLYDEFPDFQLALVDDGQLVAEVHALSVPVAGDELPAGWDEAFELGMQAGGGNVLSLLAISVASSRRGGGLATRLIGAAREAAAQAGLESVIAPVRPTLKERYPLIPIEEFMTWRRADGTSLDPWLRVHERVGGRIERAAPRSMLIEAPVADWERWTQMVFPADGTYVVPGMLAPLEVRDGVGVHVEPNVWFRHSALSRRSPTCHCRSTGLQHGKRAPAANLSVVAFEIQAHRGNDPMTIRRMLAAEPSSLELDVGLANGRLVVAHDVDHDDASGLRFDRALELAAGTQVMVEARCFPPTTPSPHEFVQALRPHLARIAVCSFSEPVLAEIARLRGSVETTLLFNKPQPIATVARTLGPRHDVVTRELVEAAHAVGLRVVPWTVNDVRRMAELVALGVDGLVTDEPALAREVAHSQLAAVA